MVCHSPSHKSLVLLAESSAAVVLLAVQIKRDSQGRLIRVWTVAQFLLFSARARMAWKHSRIWNRYFALQNTRGTTSSSGEK